VLYRSRCFFPAGSHDLQADVAWRAAAARNCFVIMQTILVVQVQQSAGVYVCDCLCIRTITFELHDQ